jgi:glutamine amidotransferase
LVATLALAHVRQASVGAAAIENTHPFVNSRWVFAHNGTLQGFAERKQRLTDAIPEDLRRQISGATDSEHIFYFWLGRLRQIVGDFNGAVTIENIRKSLKEAVQLLVDWFPDQDGEPTKLNFLLTNGSLLAATRWQHSLFALERTESPGLAVGNPTKLALIASAPTTGEDWREVPDRSLLIVDEQLNVHASSLAH